MWLCRLSGNGGSLLVPPVGGSARMAELGPLLPQDILLEGSNWKESSVDIAIAGEFAHMCTLFQLRQSISLLHQSLVAATMP